MPSSLRKLLCALTLLICFLTKLSAQKSGDDCEICINGHHAEPRPYELSFKHEIPFILTGLGTMTAGFIAQAANNEKFLNLADVNQLDVNGISSFDRSAVYNTSNKAASYSDFFRTSITLLPIYFVSNHHTKEDIWPLVAMSLEVMSTTFGLTNLSKNIVRRPRPFAYNPDTPLEKKFKLDTKRSFFSGHTSHTAAFTFFMAKVVSDYHPNMKKGLKAIMWGGAVLIPATTAYLRVLAGRHFPTDVMAGYAVGAFVGYIIPHFHRKKKKEDPVLSWQPLLLGDYAGLSLSIRLNK
ncbi:MAG: phosphatase PAP2 family protein [Cyclobacteriaceae bacterium]